MTDRNWFLFEETLTIIAVFAFFNLTILGIAWAISFLSIIAAWVFAIFWGVCMNCCIVTVLVDGEDPSDKFRFN